MSTSERLCCTVRAMSKMRIREIEIENVRTIRKLGLRLSGLVVLIGENGSGKSSIIEAVELLRRIGAGTFDPDFRNIHGGGELVLRRGATHLSLAVTAEWSTGDVNVLVRYVVTLTFSRGQYAISQEGLEVTNPEQAQPLLGFDRDASGLRFFNGKEFTPLKTQLNPLRPFLTEAAPAHAVCDDLRSALASLEVHSGFDVLPWWVTSALNRETRLRERARVSRAEHLTLLGGNLAAAYHTLKNEHPYHASWSKALDWVRLGIGDHIEEVLLPSAGAGFVELSLKLRGVDQPVPSAGLSNGQLAWLSFVALARLGVEERALLAFDEPELHLHPALLARATQLFAEVAERHPVLLATHSRRLLDALGERAAESALLCEFDPTDNTTRIRRFDGDALRDWLTRYDGLGQVLDAGYEQHVLQPREPDAFDAPTPREAP